MARLPSQAQDGPGTQASADYPKPEAPAPMRPGDEAPAGTPGTGETVCRRCAGSGVVDGKPCPDCEGSGKVIAGIGGA